MNDGYTLTVEDVCRRYGVGRKTVYYWKESGRISGVKVGRRLYFRPEDVEQLARPFASRWYAGGAGEGMDADGRARELRAAVDAAAEGVELAGGPGEVRAWLEASGSPGPDGRLDLASGAPPDVWVEARGDGAAVVAVWPPYRMEREIQGEAAAWTREAVEGMDR